MQPHTEQVTIKRRWPSSLPEITVSIECEPTASVGVKLGLAVKVAFNRGSVLRGAVLSRADLRGADLSGDWTMPDGLKWSEYLRDVVPVLLTVSGKTMAEIEASDCWDCHSWSNCPMHVAFDVSGTEQMVGPHAIYRGRAEEFIRFFDARLIPAPWSAPAEAA